MHRAAPRRKISTTVATETLAYLERLVKSGGALNLAEAIDRTVRRAKRADSVERLSRDTAAYFQALNESSVTEESGLEAAVGTLADEVDFER